MFFLFLFCDICVAGDLYPVYGEVVLGVLHVRVGALRGLRQGVQPTKLDPIVQVRVTWCLVFGFCGKDTNVSKTLSFTRNEKPVLPSGNHDLLHLIAKCTEHLLFMRARQIAKIQTL